MARIDHPIREAQARSQATFAFSTEMVAASDRVRFFREELSKMLRLDVELLDDSSPRYAISSILAGPAMISSVEGSPTVTNRSQAHLRDGDDSFLLTLQTTGRQNITHNGRDVTLGPGDAAIIHNARPSSASFPEGGSVIAIRVEGTALRGLVRQPEAVAGDLINCSRPGLSLLRGYLNSFSDQDSQSLDLLRTFGLHVVDLIAAVVSNHFGVATQSHSGGIRSARLRQVLARIASGACDPNFNVEVIAAEFAVSSRMIQLLLEETGSTFSEHVSEHRLQRARRVLLAPTSDSSIADIAYSAGFNDLSHFYRTFRRRFGETPSSARASGRRPH